MLLLGDFITKGTLVPASMRYFKNIGITDYPDFYPFKKFILNYVSNLIDLNDVLDFIG